jgi:hypothetical protein
MPIKIRYIKYLFMLAGVVLFFTYLMDGKWGQAAEVIRAIIFLGLLGYGVERLWLYVNRSPGGTRWSRFLIGR